MSQIERDMTRQGEALGRGYGNAFRAMAAFSESFKRAFREALQPKPGTYSPEDLRERRAIRLHEIRIEGERKAGRRYVNGLLDDLCRQYGLDPRIARRPR